MFVYKKKCTLSGRPGRGVTPMMISEKKKKKKVVPCLEGGGGGGGSKRLQTCDFPILKLPLPVISDQSLMAFDT